MDANGILTQVVPSVVGGATLLGLSLLLKSRDKQGGRLGKVEQWIDKEVGRREGYAEALRDLERGRVKSGG